MNEFYSLLIVLYEWLFSDIEAFFYFIPLLMIFEMPILILVIIGVMKWYLSSENNPNQDINFAPSVSFFVTCYNEKHRLIKTIRTIQEQIYSGNIETYLIVDGAYENKNTYKICIEAQKKYSTNIRKIIVIPKWKRGGLVSSANSALAVSENDICFRVDGDCSFDNDMVFEMIKMFKNPSIVASGGTLRVQNQYDSILTILQSIEYIISIQQGKVGMSNLGFLNNISGAFGVFRKSILKKTGAWMNDTAEDLDLTIRLKQYFKRYPRMKLAFQPTAVNHTEVPSSLKDFILQRIRWDGDLTFQILKKHKAGFTPKLLGWKNFIFTFLYDIIQIVIIPLVVVFYSAYIIFVYPIEIFIALSIFLYVFYLIISIFQFTVHLVLLSDRFKEDFQLILWIPLYPIYLISCKYISIFAFLNEIIRNGHEESNMAPWWILKNKRY